MKRGRGIRISQCMIVKNEEKHMERALSWGRGIMCEQIVVDTGSTDRTVALAEQMGAKVFHFEWINDFAAAKNYAIEQAGGDWIAFLDADEYVKAEDVEKIPYFLNQINKGRYLAMITQWLNLDDAGKLFCGGTQMRFFKNLPDVRYRGSIHERLSRNGRDLDLSEMVDATGEIVIYHDGYKKSVAGKGEKGARNRPLILKELEDNPDSGELMGYLADCYLAEDKPELAELWYEQAVAVLERRCFEYNQRASMTLSGLLRLLCGKYNEIRLLEVYDIAVSVLPKEADFDYITGRYFARQGEYQKGAAHLEKALQLLERHGDNGRAMYLTGDLPGTWELLALCCYNNGELGKCVNCCVSLLRAQKYIMATLVILLTAFRRNQPVSEVMRLLGQLYDLSSLKDRVFILRTSMKAGYDELSEAVRGGLSAEERESFERAVGMK